MDSSTEEKTFAETFNGTSSPLENDSSLTANEDQICSICNNKYIMPRLLSCLHIFCESCLNKQLSDNEGGGDMIIRDGILTCPECQQKTKVGPKGAASLPCDYVLMNILDMSAISNTSVECTSCKTKEYAIARCSDCANFLCPNCNTAHQFMRCFENHHVVKFEDLKKSKEALPIHKPVFCELHSTEPVKFYCYTCQVLICNECLVVEHCSPEHHYERLSEAADKQLTELQSLIAESRAKGAHCEELTAQLHIALNDLQMQHDTAGDLIKETFQSYKAVLEKLRDDRLEELKSIHKQRELKLMETFHSLEKSVECIENACKFTTRLLELGNAAEILSLRRCVSTQLLNLINNTHKPDVNVNIEFKSDMNKFTDAIQSTFGSFRKEVPPTAAVSVSPQEDQRSGGGVQRAMSSASAGVTCPPSSMTSSPVSSFEGELFQSQPSPVVLPPLTMMQEYNLTQLASLAVVDKLDHSPQSASPTPPQTFSLVDFFPGDISSNALSNLQALAKLGNEPETLTNGSINGTNGVITGRQTSYASLRGLLPPIEASIPLTNGSGGYAPSSPSLSQSDGLAPSITSRSLGGFASGRLQNGKSSAMQIRSKFGQMGSGDGQFNSPHGFCLGVEEDIIVADTNNHRIQVFDKGGVFKFQFGSSGKEEGQLWYPRKVAVMRPSGKFVICDRGNERSRMQLFNKNGQFLKKIAIRYIDIVAGLAVSNGGRIVAVDSVSPTVFIIGETGDLLNWFDCSDHMREPSDIAVNGKEFYVCDFKGHCVVVFTEMGKFVRRIGGENITNFPNGIDISDAGDVLVGDSHGNRFHIAVFNKDGLLLCEFECPYVKVSRCCGLKITSEGYVVTLAKNNHHVLVLNTLYIQ
ncbi:brain tumor protein [Nilaparvata lugens]|uniref:brain tumor protein n=1 Tax=Nilaparvata lugens TaxID=108931 RepID=UPI00193D4D94|nr:brain tumor protein [Nilaparvata lugens]